jgi:hypothetical protein
MQRLMSRLRLGAGLAAAVALAVAALPALGAASGPSAWRFRVNPTPVASQTVTVVRASHGWFVATDAAGKEKTVVFPRRHGYVQHEGHLIATEALRRGDRVEVWGLQRGSTLQSARARLIDGPTAHAAGTRQVAAGCCAACATCNRCDSGCANCASPSDCQTCCGASCSPTATCCA